MVSYEQSLAYGLLKRFESYRHQVEQFATIANQCPLPIFVMAHDGLSLLYVNPAYTRLTGCTVDQLNGENYIKIIAPVDRERSIAIWKKFVEDRQDVHMTEYYLDAETGQPILCLVDVYAVAGNGFVGYIRPEGWCSRQDLHLHKSA